MTGVPVDVSARSAIYLPCETLCKPCVTLCPLEYFLAFLLVFCALDLPCLRCGARRLAEQCTLGSAIPRTERVSGVDCKHDASGGLGECRAQQAAQIIRSAQRVGDSCYARCCAMSSKWLAKTPTRAACCGVRLVRTLLPEWADCGCCVRPASGETSSALSNVQGRQSWIWQIAPWSRPVRPSDSRVATRTSTGTARASVHARS
jgi:hypothetical protein